MVEVARILAFELGEIDLADRSRLPHLLGAVALGTRDFGRTGGYLHGFGGVERLHVGFDDGDADVVRGFGDRECVDAVLEPLFLDRRAQFAAFVERQPCVDSVSAGVAVVVFGVRRRVVRVALCRRDCERRQPCGLCFAGIFEP